MQVEPAVIWIGDACDPKPSSLWLKNNSNNHYNNNNNNHTNSNKSCKKSDFELLKKWHAFEKKETTIFLSDFQDLHKIAFDCKDFILVCLLLKKNIILYFSVTSFVCSSSKISCLRRRKKISFKTI